MSWDALADTRKPVPARWPKQVFYFEAEIVKGEIKAGDIAMKKGAYCLIQKPS